MCLRLLVLGLCIVKLNIKYDGSDFIISTTGTNNETQDQNSDAGWNTKGEGHDNKSEEGGGVIHAIITEK